MNSATVAFALVAAGANVLGAAAVTARRQWSVRALEAMVALSAGFMIAVALVDVIPEAIERTGHRAAAVVLGGYLLVYLTQHALTQHFHFGEEMHEVSEAVSRSALVGLMLHTFVDGVAIASGFAVSRELGLLVFAAIVLHKLPEGLAISSLFLAAGASRARALMAAAALGATTLAGALLTDSVGPLAVYGLPLAGGVTLYVGASNLVPEFQSKSGWLHPAAFFAGCALYFLTRTAVAH